MKKYHNLGLAVLSALLLYFSWYPNGFAGFIFIALIPLFKISDNLIANSKNHSVIQFFGYSLLTFLIWNGCTTWWIYLAAGVGGILAVVVNALLMTIVVTVWHFFKIKIHGRSSSFLMFIAFWISFEYLHLHWDLNWPWLNLGNVFAACPNWVQWYEYTGAFGGSLWIIGLNILIYQLWICFKAKNPLMIKRYLIAVLCTLIIPLFLSLMILKTYHEHGDKIEAVIVQQNTDPWVEQYQFPNQYHIHKILKLARPYITDSTQLLLVSESGIPNTILESEMRIDTMKKNQNYNFIDSLQLLTKQYPYLTVCFGASTAEIFTQKTLTSRPYGKGEYIDMYNTAVLYSRGQPFEFYHKARLVPAVEKMPFPKLLAPLEKLAINLGGTTGSLGKGEFQKVFSINKKSIKYGTAICYESVFGEVFSNFVKDGAQFMSIITNDSWWGTSAGHRQHFEMARLRAIETRRYIIRAANTGISGVITSTGKIQQKTKYGQTEVIKAQFSILDNLTFYVKYGDYIARLCVCMTILYFIYLPFACIIRKLRTGKFGL